jgi:hypothetical protein
MSKVIPEPNSGCWIWGGGVSSNGYGNFHDGERVTGAHNYSWRLHRGAIQSGLFVCHRCDTPLCVNPDHLFLDTPAGNLDDARKKGRTGLVRFDWSYPPGVKEKVLADKRTYAEIAEDYGLTHMQVKNIKLKASRDIRSKRQRELKEEAKRLRDALSYFAEMDATNPPSGIRLGDWLAGVTSARAALKGAE